MTISVIVNVLLAAGWLFLAMSLNQPRRGGEYLAMASPFFGPGNITFHGADGRGGGEWLSVMAVGFVWSFAFVFAAIGLFLVNYLTFNHFVGRVSEMGVVPVQKGKYELDVEFAMLRDSGLRIP